MLKSIFTLGLGLMGLFFGETSIESTPLTTAPIHDTKEIPALRRVHALRKIPAWGREPATVDQPDPRTIPSNYYSGSLFLNRHLCVPLSTSPMITVVTRYSDDPTPTVIDFSSESEFREFADQVLGKSKYFLPGDDTTIYFSSFDPDKDSHWIDVDDSEVGALSDVAPRTPTAPPIIFEIIPE